MQCVGQGVLPDASDEDGTTLNVRTARPFVAGDRGRSVCIRGAVPHHLTIILTGLVFFVVIGGCIDEQDRWRAT